MTSYSCAQGRHSECRGYFGMFKAECSCSCHAPPEHYPHEREEEKIANIVAESRRVNIDPRLHPGLKMWLCKPCGTWHNYDYPGSPPRPNLDSP